MRKTLIAILLLLVAVQAPRLPASARGAAPAPDEPAAGSVVCPPGVYPAAPSDCLPLGPSEYLKDLADTGMPVDPRPLPAYPLDPGLADIPFRYFKLNDEDKSIYLFNSLEDAEGSSTSGQRYGPGEVYVSYQDVIENDSGTFFHLRSGYWARGDFGGRLGRFQIFEG